MCPYPTGVPGDVLIQSCCAWQVVHPKEAVLLGTISVPCLVRYCFLLGIQSDSKMSAERMAYSKDRYKMEAGMPSFSPAFR
jgi:hypothetical protein